MKEKLHEEDDYVRERREMVYDASQNYCLIAGSVFEKDRATAIVNEIADEMRVSTSTALSYLRDLENAGLIRREADKPRTIRIAETTSYGI